MFRSVAFGCPVAFGAVEMSALYWQVTFDFVEISAFDCPVTFEVFVAGYPIMFDLDEVIAVYCAVVIGAAVELVAADWPTISPCRDAEHSDSAALLHHRFHHQSLADCRRSEQIRPTAAAATNQSSW